MESRFIVGGFSEHGVVNRIGLAQKFILAVDQKAKINVPGFDDVGETENPVTRMGAYCLRGDVIADVENSPRGSGLGV